jgi:hypothetical protein
VLTIATAPFACDLEPTHHGKPGRGDGSRPESSAGATPAGRTLAAMSRREQTTTPGLPGTVAS